MYEILKTLTEMIKNVYKNNQIKIERNERISQSACVLFNL